MMDWFDLDYNMTYEEYQNKDKTEILNLIDLIDVLQEIVDDDDDAGDE